MPDWTNPKAYEFAAGLNRNEWAWEFMRRNPVYRAEFAGLGSAKSHYDPPKKDGETEQAWALRVTAAGAEPVRMTPYERFSRKWRIIPPIPDPNSNEPPEFDVFPEHPLFGEVRQYFEDEDPYRQVDEFAVLVFDLRSPVALQLDRAKTRLLARQKASSVKNPRNVWPAHWATYLRLIDADLAGAKSKEIRAKLDEYLPKSDDADHKHKAVDKFGDHRKYALALRDDPLSILLGKSP
jgi:hypothetical protein